MTYADALRFLLELVIAGGILFLAACGLVVVVVWAMTRGGPHD